ncbi:MAG: DUF5131 family protein [Patescibacteria group bacterium]
MSNSKIDWCDKTWNVTGGCSKVSAGCLNCWAEKLTANRFKNNPRYDGLTENGKWTGEIKLFEDRLDQPLHLRKPQRIFVCSQSDLFHEEVPFEFIAEVMEPMAFCQEHTFLILTKRPDIAAEFFKSINIYIIFPNLHLGVSVSTQEDADENIPILLHIPAVVRWVSFEPLLAVIDLNRHFWRPIIETTHNDPLGEVVDYEPRKTFNWCVIGCEHLGGGKAGRFQDGFIDAAIDIVKQCKEAGIPVFVKQIPINGKVSHNLAEWPEELRVREVLK